MRCFWRETPNADVGIDGQIEYVDEAGNATGRIVAVQVKSGTSYVPDTNDPIRVSISRKHRAYWEEFPLPVLLIAHSPTSGIAYWVDVRQALRTSAAQEAIVIPRHQILESSQRDLIFETSGALGYPLLSPLDALGVMARTHHENNHGFQLSYFDIFSNGITDIGRKLFYSIGLCMDIARYQHAKTDCPFGIDIGEPEHDFLDSYIQFLVSQSLIIYDYSDYLIDREEREVQPVFLAPFTRRGEAVIDLARELGGCGNADELTECFIGLDQNPHSIVSRFEANDTVSQRLASEVFETSDLAETYRRLRDRRRRLRSLYELRSTGKLPEIVFQEILRHIREEKDGG